MLCQVQGAAAPLDYLRIGFVRPALQTLPECPACGRPSAVLFPELRAGGAPEDAPRVCLKCCPPQPPAPCRLSPVGRAGYNGGVAT